MSRRVVFSAGALTDLLDLYDYIAPRGGAERAARSIKRLEAFCRGLGDFANRGTDRGDLRPGLRIHGFERRAVIAFQVTADAVLVLGILYGGRTVSAAFALPEQGP